ncbi:hypothetical protein OV203_21375 [Nannocystis sp. ILAH1]|uniref:hypothetical protein n=1 Tax=Nannocystis sp. ILAH1 TaxID=2996789 RepID=UPI00226FB8AA|nr:hypothetical protein [Nannocystis sp. ILAH1]MCY0989703.1 hypothetical protein [Nannocystis sp. ILAH1]
MQTNLADLRPHRQALVQAAESVFSDPHSIERERELKSQLNHLIAVCNEATCTEEIELYLRYQSAREGRHIGPELVHAIIEAIHKAFEKGLPDESRLGAWRLYAVYLARAYTYRAAVLKANPRTASHPNRETRGKQR